MLRSGEVVEDDVGRNRSGAQRGAEVPRLESSSQREPSSALAVWIQAKRNGAFWCRRHTVSRGFGSDSALLVWENINWAFGPKWNMFTSCCQHETTPSPSCGALCWKFNDLHRVQARQSAGCLPPSSGRNHTLHQEFEKSVLGFSTVTEGSCRGQCDPTDRTPKELCCFYKNNNYYYHYDYYCCCCCCHYYYK